VLRQIHDERDGAVLEAYGWQDPSSSVASRLPRRPTQVGETPTLLVMTFSPDSSTLNLPSNRREHFVENRERVVEVRFGVGEGDEAGFVGGWREVDAFVETAPEEFLEEAEVLFHDV